MGGSLACWNNLRDVVVTQLVVAPAQQSLDFWVAFGDLTILVVHQYCYWCRYDDQLSPKQLLVSLYGRLLSSFLQPGKIGAEPKDQYDSRYCRPP